MGLDSIDGPCLQYDEKVLPWVGVRERVPPFRMTRVFWKALGVIELPSGTIRESRTQLGDQLKIDFED